MRMSLVLAAALLVLPALPAAAQSGPFGSPYPWCAGFQGTRGQTYRCDFRSFEECRQEITGGNRGWCVPNARYAPARYEEPRRHRRAVYH